MYKLECAQIWGGIEEGDATVASPGLTATLFSSAGKGARGGDIYYLTLCNSTYITRVAIADVVGHGEVVSTISQSLYNSLGRHVDNLNGNDVLIDLNRDAISKGIDALTTAIIATYYREDKTFSFANAGHPPMLLNRRGGSDWMEIRSTDDGQTRATNIPLSVDENANYIQNSISLDSGDRVLLYTDGLLETPSETLEPFGMDRLLQILTRYSNKQIDELRDIVVEELCEHANHKLLHDDVTLLLLEVR